MVKALSHMYCIVGGGSIEGNLDIMGARSNNVCSLFFPSFSLLHNIAFERHSPDCIVSRSRVEKLSRKEKKVSTYLSGLSIYSLVNVNSLPVRVGERRRERWGWLMTSEPPPPLFLLEPSWELRGGEPDQTIYF